MEIGSSRVTVARVAGRLRKVRNTVVPAAGRTLSRRWLHGRIPPGSNLHLGCGPNRFPGWIQMDRDLAVRPDVLVDLRYGLPADPDVAHHIYSEHLLEHLELPDALQLLSDCHDVLQTDGVLRIAMPDLEGIVRAYLGDWRGQSWLEEPGFSYIDTAAHMLNVAVREWGHRYLYDRAELELRLHQAGFQSLRWCQWGCSEDPVLRGLETRQDSRLIVEAIAG